MRTRNDIKFEDVTLVSYIWKSEKPFRGTVTIFHGMAEHILRYDEFAEMLAEEGYTVIGHDHYAHGQSCDINHIGVVENGDFMTKINSASRAVHDFYKDEFKNTENYLFAHSMGSMAAQRYIELYPDDFKKVILSGTDIGSIKYSMASLLTKYVMKKHGPISYTKIVDNLSLKPFNKKFKNDHPEVGWLSKNKENIEKYVNDPLCGTAFPTNYFYSLANCLNEAKKNIDKINKNTKIMLIAGNDDPVTNYAKSTEALQKLYKKHHINCYACIYTDARHELINEVKEVKEEVLKDIINFYNEY